MTAFAGTAADDLAVNAAASNNILTDDVIAETLGIDEGQLGWTLISKLLAEDIDVNDTPVAVGILSEALSETCAIDDGVPAALRLVVAGLDENVELNDDLTLNAILNLVIDDSVVFGAVLVFGDEQFVCWVANADTFAHSSYENFDFDRMTRLGDHYYGTKPDGIYKFEGGTDGGTEIDWFVALPHTDMGLSNFKRMPRCYMGFKADGNIYLRTITDHGVERVYLFQKQTDNVAGAGLPLGRGVKSRYWGFDLIGVDGPDFDLESIEFFPVILGRRVP